MKSITSVLAIASLLWTGTALAQQGPGAKRPFEPNTVLKQSATVRQYFEAMQKELAATEVYLRDIARQVDEVRSSLSGLVGHSMQSEGGNFGSLQYGDQFL